jgi:hypothetical protein
MKKIDNLKANTAEKLIKGLMEKNAVINTDESTTYAEFTDFVDFHVKEISTTEEDKFNHKCAHKAISNLKSNLRRYIMRSEKFIQN